jgi:2-polyprenyl-3-methyl-5-hydroxy-6-metoxy-1,4-benzoquinol methylase/spore coat polysaccharide biosynthesis predicted glycosyltransferase SpsG
MPDRATEGGLRNRSFLLVPAAGAGEGMGHLVRSLRLSRHLGSRVSIFLVHVDEPARRLLRETVARLPRGRRPGLLTSLPGGKKWDLIVTDARRVEAEELERLSRRGLVAGIDEGGEARELASFILDTLPGPPGRSPANQADLSFLFLPPRVRKAPPAVIRKILLSLGGEDLDGAGPMLAAAMISAGVCNASQLTAVQGPLSRPLPGGKQWPVGVKVIAVSDQFAKLLPRHDVLITHFGMSAFEALACGIPAVLFNPTQYHARLGAAAGFPMIGVSEPRIGLLKGLLAEPALLYSHVRKFNESVGPNRGKRLVEVLRPLTRIGSASCPVCGQGGNRVIARFPDRTYRRCAACGTIGLESFTGTRKSYTSEYFSTEYKAQYGRTYLEDFGAIRAASRPRAAIIRRLLGPLADGMVLDVGCAYGPFLAAAADERLHGFGLDISPGAAAYVRKTLGFPAICASFETVARNRLPRKISAVTMWYVIEHLPRTREVLARSSALLPPGGVLAFSTPNGRGVSARRDQEAFLRNSPADHFAVLSPRGLAGILSPHDLELKRIRVTGHHPERFPGLLGGAARAWRWAARVLRTVSVLFRLGDTFEAYAVKLPTANANKGPT